MISRTPWKLTNARSILSADGEILARIEREREDGEILPLGNALLMRSAPDAFAFLRDLLVKIENPTERLEICAGDPTHQDLVTLLGEVRGAA